MIRRALGDAIITAGDDVRLDGTYLRVDVRDFERGVDGERRRLGDLLFHASPTREADLPIYTANRAIGRARRASQR